MAPGKNATVGIAQPLSIVFDHPVTNKAEVEKHLKVTTSDNTEGSWGWMRGLVGQGPGRLAAQGRTGSPAPGSRSTRS